MHRIKLISLVLAIVSGVLIATVAIGQTAGDPNRVDKVSNKSFNNTVKALEKALKSEGMMIVATIDHQNMLKMVGAEIKGSITIEFGKPDMMKMLLPMNPAIGLEMPVRLYIWETAGGRVKVSYRKVAPQFDTYGNPEVSKMGEMMDMMLDKFSAEAIN